MTSGLARLRARLNRGDSWLTYDLGRLFARDTLAGASIEELEHRLLAADAGVETATRIAERLRIAVNQGKIRSEADLRAALKEGLLEILKPCARPLQVPPAVRPFVIMAVGVNGAGKTTTIGKIAQQLRASGHSVLLAAGDTFRAAAVGQLETWAERAGAALVSQGAGADAASVIFDAVQAAKSRGVDVVIADTAGRLHTQAHLMDELKKIQRVMRKQEAAAPHETLLVLDATMGGNALHQAQQFHQALGVTGLVLTKLDGTAKGGTLLSIAARLALPIRFIGVGEGAEDLLPFDAEEFVEALIS